MRKFFLFIFVLQFTACHKEISPAFSNNTPNSLSQSFEQFWQKMNANYLYWDVDTTDWNYVYQTYKPLFEQLDINNSKDVQKSISYFRQITQGLIDSHYVLNFFNPIVKDSSIFPALERKIKLNSLHTSYSYIGIDTNYFDKGFLYGTYITKEQQQTFALFGTIRRDILYFGCNQFALQEAYKKADSNGVKSILKAFFNVVENLPNSTKGVIIDMRNNVGGNITDLNFFLGHFIAKPLVYGYTHYKSGTGRLDYTPWIEATILPQPSGKILNVPIVVLANSYSISLAEALTMAIKAMPKSTFVGETTWGATGPVTDNMVYNDGAFTVPNFLTVFTSSAAFKYIDGNRYEGKGFPPDVYVPFNLNALLSGYDPQLDKAISLIP